MFAVRETPAIAVPWGPANAPGREGLHSAEPGECVRRWLSQPRRSRSAPRLVCAATDGAAITVLSFMSCSLSRPGLDMRRGSFSALDACTLSLEGGELTSHEEPQR